MDSDIYEKITSLDDISDSLKDALESSDIGQTYSENVQELCDFLREIRQSGDFEAMLRAETALMAKDIEKALSREPRIALEMQRIDMAEGQLVKGQKCYDQLIKDIDTYRTYEYYSKKASDGYPRDACREFLNSQCARMRDILKRPENKEQVAILEARHANLKEMEKFYRVLQKKLLPEPLRGVESIKHYQEEAAKQGQKPDNTNKEKNL